METVEKSILVTQTLETTTLKVVYTPVNSSVDNSVTCGMYFWFTQMEASNSLNIGETNSYPQVFEQV